MKNLGIVLSEISSRLEQLRGEYRKQVQLSAPRRGAIIVLDGCVSIHERDNDRGEGSVHFPMGQGTSVSCPVRRSIGVLQEARQRPQRYRRTLLVGGDAT